MAARRWLLFGLSLASLLAMTYAGVSLAYSLKVTPEMAEANPEAKVGSRLILRVFTSPSEVRTLAADGEGDLLASADAGASFVMQARNVSLGRALAYVEPDAKGTYTPATVANERNETVEVAALAGGGKGWIVQGASEPAPRFVAAERVVGKVESVENATLLPALFMGGLVGFVAPLVGIVLTHRGAGHRARDAPAGLCRECRAPMPPQADFCIRCGAYAKEA